MVGVTGLEICIGSEAAADGGGAPVVVERAKVGIDEIVSVIRGVAVRVVKSVVVEVSCASRTSMTTTVVVAITETVRASLGSIDSEINRSKESCGEYFGGRPKRVRCPSVELLE